MFEADTTSGTRSPHNLALYSAITAAFLLLLLLMDVTWAHAAGLEPSPKKEVVSVRFVGRAASVPITSFGANHHSFVAVLHFGNSHDVSLVKIVYRFLSYDTSLPASLMNYDIVHKFRAVRQTDCDEVADTLLYSHRLSSSGGISGRDFSFQYARNASGITIPPDSVLPCYIVTPADYKGSAHVPANVPDSAAGKETLDATQQPRGLRP